MKPVLSPEQAAELDRATQLAGTPAEVLMERAGRAVARAAVDLMGGTYGRRVVVVAGPGNNGGDGLVAARHLARWGAAVTVVTVGGLPDRGAAAANAERLRSMGIPLLTFEAEALDRELDRADLAVDAVFGIGFHGAPGGAFANAISVLDRAGAPVVAVDIPSGVDAATGTVPGAVARAELTVTFGAAKTGAVLLPGGDAAGALRVVDIGFPDDLVHADVFLSEPEDVARVSPRRIPDGHKRASGTLVVVAGSRRMTGAASLIARAAMRVGAGLVTVAVPEGILHVVQAAMPEAVFLELPETPAGTVGQGAITPVLEALERADAVAIGPGLTAREETAAFVAAVVRAAPVPMILDADGLNAFAGRAGDLAERKADGRAHAAPGRVRTPAGAFPGRGRAGPDSRTHARSPAKPTPSPC